MTVPAIEHAVASAVSVRRLVNDSIRDGGAFRADTVTSYEFLCECGDLRCRELVSLTVTQYDALEEGTVVAHPEACA